MPTHYQIKLAPGDWEVADIPEVLRNLAAERYPGDTPVLYRMSGSDRRSGRAVDEAVVVYFESAATLVVFSKLGIPVRIEDIRPADILPAVTRFVGQQDDWLRGRFALTAAPFVWAFQAQALLRAAEALRHKADEARAASLKATLAELARGDFETGARIADPEETERILDAGLSHQALFLLGLGIENAAKGILCQDEGGMQTHPTTGDLRISERLKAHDLLDLVVASGEPLADDERAALGELSEWVIWRGRYPVPLVYRTFSDFAYSKTLNGDLVYERARTILGRLLNRLRQGS